MRFEIVIKKDPTKFDFQHYIDVVDCHYKCTLSHENIAMLLNINRKKLVTTLLSFNGVILNLGIGPMFTSKIFYKNIEEAKQAKEWIESCIVVNQLVQKN